MALIDQRILIDAPPQVIWEFISDPDKVPRWHAGYTGVSVLTTQRTGAGTRRRCSPVGGGKDVIEEITAWVDGLGYEYRLMEGGPYRTFQGRLRLQVGPDGTTVQWTVSYHRKGLFGFVQDQLKGRGQLVKMMADSLRQLRRQIDTMGIRMDADQRAKAGIQGRLDADARAQYQRRHAPPPGLETAAPPAESNADIPAEAVPSFVAELTGESGPPEYSHKVDTKPRPPEGLREAIAAQSAAPTPEPTADIPAEAADTLPAPPDRITPPEPLPPVVQTPLPAQPEPSPFARPQPVVPETPLTPSAAEPEHKRITPPRGIPSVDVPTQPTPPREPTPSESTPAVETRAIVPPQTPVHDTGEISIWEVFGIKRPSQQDTETLEDLIRTVKKRKMGAKRRIGQRIPKRRARVRRLKTVVGLRVWLALRAAHIRLNESEYDDWE